MLTHLEKANQIKKDANWGDLDVIKKSNASLKKILTTKDLVSLDLS
jgi:hypothetical protein